MNMKLKSVVTIADLLAARDSLLYVNKTSSDRRGAETHINKIMMGDVSTVVHRYMSKWLLCWIVYHLVRLHFHDASCIISETRWRSNVNLFAISVHRKFEFHVTCLLSVSSYLLLACMVDGHMLKDTSSWLVW